MVTFTLALKHIRHTVFFVIAASLFSFRYFEEFARVYAGPWSARPGPIFSERWVRLLDFSKTGLVLGFLFIGAVYGSYFTSLRINVDDTWLPVKAIEHIKKSDLKGNLLVSFNWGGYALYQLFPQCRVSMDGRYEETYTNESYEEVFHFFYRKEGWDKILWKYRHDLILVHIKSKTYKELLKMEEWEKVYQDEMAAIFVPA